MFNDSQRHVFLVLLRLEVGFTGLLDQWQVFFSLGSREYMAPTAVRNISSEYGTYEPEREEKQVFEVFDVDENLSRNETGLAFVY